MAKEACLATLSLLEQTDQLEVIAFDSRPTRVVPMQSARRSERIAFDLGRLESGGGTEIFPALDLAYKDLLGVTAKKKHIVLLTDGNADSEGLAELASAALADGITLTTVGFGVSIHETLLRSLSDLGGGRYHLARDASGLPRIFTRETELLTLEETSHELLTIQVQNSRPWLKGVPFVAAPPLLGAAKLRLGPPPAQVILGLDSGYPLLAETRFGQGSTLAWASDLKSNYARQLLGWPHLPRFLAQLVRAHQKSGEEGNWPMEAKFRGDELLVSFDAPSGESGFKNDVHSRLFVQLGTEERAGREQPFSWVLPGRYEARVRTPTLGVVRLHAQHQDGKGKDLARSSLRVSQPYPEEYRRATGSSPEPTPPGLIRIEEPRDVLGRDTRASTRKLLGSWFLSSAALLLVLDIALRRWGAMGFWKRA
jgi:Ca-activated chloride channel homolog